MYKVIKYFMDLNDNSHEYNVGDVFPRKGFEVSEERIAELSGTQNKQGCPLIAPAEEPAAKKAPAKKASAKASE